MWLLFSVALVDDLLLLLPLDQWQYITVGHAVEEATQIMLVGKQRPKGQGCQ